MNDNRYIALPFWLAAGYVAWAGILADKLNSFLFGAAAVLAIAGAIAWLRFRSAE